MQCRNTGEIAENGGNMWTCPSLMKVLKTTRFRNTHKIRDAASYEACGIKIADKGGDCNLEPACPWHFVTGPAGLSHFGIDDCKPYGGPSGSAGARVSGGSTEICNAAAADGDA